MSSSMTCDFLRKRFERVVQILNLKLGLGHAVDIFSHAVQLTWQAHSFRPDYRNFGRQRFRKRQACSIQCENPLDTSSPHTWFTTGINELHQTNNIRGIDTAAKHTV